MNSSLEKRESLYKKNQDELSEVKNDCEDLRSKIKNMKN